MFDCLGLALALSLGQSPGAGPGEPPVPVERLIQQLGDKDFKVREAAGKTLEARGDAVLTALRKAQTHPDTETRKRLADLVSKIERAVLLSPKLVTVQMDQRPVADVFAEITRQTGYKLQVQKNGPQPIVSIAAENQPFWQVIDGVCKQAGLSLQPYHDGSGGWLFTKQNGGSMYVAYQGAFRLAASSFHYSKTMNLAQPANGLLGRNRSESLTFMFSVIGEPKTPLLGLGQPKLSVALDDQDNSLLLVMPRNAYESNYHGYYGDRNLAKQTQVQLAGHGGARLLKQVRGSLPVSILAEQRPEIVIDDILKVKNKKFEGGQVALEIDEVKEGPGKQVQIKATARRTAGDSNNHDFTWTNSLHQRVELQDEKGNRFHAQGFNWDSGSQTSVQGTFTFDAGGNNQLGKAAKLIYYGWITTQHQVEFEFKDLPLP